MKMCDEVSHYSKEYVYERYVRIIRDFKDYDKITKKKCFEKIYDLYNSDIIQLCTRRELKH